MSNQTEITWLGHACFLLKTGDISILIDPFIHNPMAPEGVSEESLDVDFILVTHGHGDHVGSAVEIMKMHQKTKLIGIVELCGILESQGIDGSRMIAMNIGGTVPIGQDVSVTMVHALHTTGFTYPNGETVYAGEAAGFVIHSADGHHIYHCGDTGVFGDMKVIDDIYTPDICLLCIGDFYTMGPKEASYAVNQLLKHCKMVIPMHYKTFGLLTGTPEALKEGITRDDCEVKPLVPGEVFRVYSVCKIKKTQSMPTLRILAQCQ